MIANKATKSLMGLVVVAGCAGEGPRTQAIMNAPNAMVVSRDLAEDYLVLDVDRRIAEQASHYVRTGRHRGFFVDTIPGELAIGVGDTLEITIVSTSENGYIDFASSSVAPIATTELPAQEVNSAGNINVPPLGRVSAAGKTVSAFEEMLAARLGEVLVDPSVIVRLTNRQSARVAVVGSVALPGTVSITDTNARLIDMITAVGGPTARPEDLELLLSRRGRTGRITLSALFENPGLNVHALPGDVLTIQTPDRRLVVLGAGRDNQTIRFDEPSVSLVDALARAGGLEPRRADKRGVFIYRDTMPEQVNAMGVTVPPSYEQSVPTIFRFDLSEPSALFAARDFEIDDGDILFISNSVNDEIDAVISAISPFVPTIDEYVRDATLGSN